MWTHDNDKAQAVSRLWQAVHHALGDDDFDQEECDHLKEIMRLIETNVPAECFAGLGDFNGSD